MFQAMISDAALAAAKANGHEAVEVRHVVYALARRFRNHPAVANALVVARRALEPRGTWHGLPTLTAEAASLLATLVGEDAGVVILQRLLESSDAPSPPQAGTVASAVPSPATEPDTGRHAVPGQLTPESTERVLSELDGLVGLAAVKAQVRTMIAVAQANRERASAGLPTVQAGLHLVFTGPPGTGKTTVARLIARLYAAAGLLPGSNFREVTRADLVAGYVGQTAIKTTSLIQEVRPGVLFIDEAYSLAPSHDSDFGAEAIATLVKAMEDHRNEFAVIVAGYGEEMARFIESNPGLRSRFKTFIAFPDYSPDELCRIFDALAQDHHIHLQEGVLAKVRRIVEAALTTSDHGNARFTRSLFERAYGRMAARAAADGTVTLDELHTILVDDIEDDAAGRSSAARPIGFA